LKDIVAAAVMPAPRRADVVARFESPPVACRLHDAAIGDRQPHVLEQSVGWNSEEGREASRS
jgi:hypothetical protein